jgi:DNA-directed RNA polymerase specialized sigma24 family protein
MNNQTTDSPKDAPYTTSIVREVLNLWPQIDAVRERGTLALFPIAYTTSLESKVAAAELSAACPRPSGRRNLPYRIDDVACVVMDIFQGVERSLTPKAKARLSLHYRSGYKHAELAQMEGVSEEAIKVSCHRSIEKIVEYLEAPKKPIEYDWKIVDEQDATHRRKYASY